MRTEKTYSVSSHVVLAGMYLVRCPGGDVVSTDSETYKWYLQNVGSVDLQIRLCDSSQSFNP